MTPVALLLLSMDMLALFPVESNGCSSQYQKSSHTNGTIVIFRAPNCSRILPAPIRSVFVKSVGCPWPASLTCCQLTLANAPRAALL